MGIITFINYKIFIIHLLFFKGMLFYFFENVTTLEICQDLHEQRLCKIPLGPCLIGHISHNRLTGGGVHFSSWCSF